MLSGGECGIWSITIIMGGMSGCFWPAPVWIYAAVAFMHMPTAVLYRIVVSNYVVANVPSSLFFPAHELNGLAW
jgi:hypothetical protein